MLFKVFTLITGMLIFGGIASALIGYVYFLRRTKLSAAKTMEWSLRHQLFVVGVLGVSLAIVFVTITSAFIHYWAYAELMSKPGSAVIAQRIGIPTDKLTVEEWTRSQVCSAYISNDDLALATRRQILSNLVIGNENEFRVVDNNRMVKVIANAARLKGLEATPKNFVGMLEYAATGGTCLEGEDQASCREVNSDCLGEIGGVEGMDRLVAYLRSQIIPPIFSLSLFGADNLPPKPRQIRYRMFSEFGGDADSVVGRYATYLEHDPVLSNEAIPVIEAYIDVMIEVVADQRRLLSLVYGPIQLITMALFFGALILAFERIWLIRDATRGLDAYLKKKKAEGLSMDRLRIEFQEVVYTPINYIIWALPTLGFIGTVTGISAAISDAHKVAENIGPVAQGEAIEGVTTLLGIAFDTTFIALVCSLPLMAVIAAIRARETRSMNAVIEE